MKKLLLFFVMLLLNFYALSYAACLHSGGHHARCNHAGTYRSTSSSGGNHVYLVNRDYSKTEQKFQNCNEHYMTVEKVIYHYSDGSRRTSTNCTIYNSDGTVLDSGCMSVKHVLYDGKHYFVICKGNCYIIDSNGNKLTKRKYSQIEEYKTNRFIVRSDKRYGIIDINENVIVPLIYQKFINQGDIFITKLNGYWGILDSENNVLVKNDCEKIKPMYDAILLKRYGKYGLADLDGKILYDIKYDKIKKLGEYIIVRDSKKYFVLDLQGKILSNTTYRKLKLRRNTLFGMSENGEWCELK